MINLAHFLSHGITSAISNHEVKYFLQNIYIHCFRGHKRQRTGHQIHLQMHLCIIIRID